MPFGLGKLFYVCLLMINAVAVLSEDRFLARSTYYALGGCETSSDIGYAFALISVGWSSNQPVPPSYDQSGFGEQGMPGVKARLINLISAVRTLMRIPLIGINIIIILYELVLG
ncbi:hypothetical protein FRB99_005420 [Tulasnella sp. 403]|nr:hypothetical protein FRB99_005420 [Tulasnella sp. 403]